MSIGHASIRVSQALDGGPNLMPRYLACELAALPGYFLQATDFAEESKDSWLEKLLRRCRCGSVASRVRHIRSAVRMFQTAPSYDVVVTLGDLAGLTFAMLQRLRRKQRPIHIMYDCLWYGGSTVKRSWMKFCLEKVDCCVVWASLECESYSQCYKIDPHKFVYVPHHHTANRYDFETSDEGYVFTGGNWNRDYLLFLQAVHDLEFPCVIATTRQAELMRSVELPAHVRVVAASHAEFRQLIAKASIVVLPLQGGLLHIGGQQTILNAMLMGKPVIVTDPDGGRDYIDDGVNGRLIPYGKSEELRLAIAQLMSDPALIRSMGNAAKHKAAPYTTEACNTRIWEQGRHLFQMRRSGQQRIRTANSNV